jgi:hypothetical protein
MSVSPQLTRPGIEPGAVLAAVKHASRRLRRWPAAILDRACARRLAVIRPGRKNAAQPNRKTSVIKHERSFLPTPSSEEADFACADAGQFDSTWM